MFPKCAMIRLKNRTINAAFGNPKTYDGCVLLLRGSREAPYDRSNGTLGWSEVLTGPVKMEDVPGHRVGLLDEPRVGAVARSLRLALDRADTRIGNHESQPDENESEFPAVAL